MVAENRDTLWLRGRYPKSYLATEDDASYRWRNSFVQTILERDLPQFGIRIPAPTLRRFWQMAAHVHGQIWNAASAEVDLVEIRPDRKPILYEMKHSLSPKTTKGLRSAMVDLAA